MDWQILVFYPEPTFVCFSFLLSLYIRMFQFFTVALHSYVSVFYCRSTFVCFSFFTVALHSYVSVFYCHSTFVCFSFLLSLYIRMFQFFTVALHSYVSVFCCRSTFVCTFQTDSTKR